MYVCMYVCMIKNINDYTSVILKNMNSSSKESELGSVYVSITGLRIRSNLHYPQFYRLAGAVMTQAKKSHGIIEVEARIINGIHHTLSIWESEYHMREFLLTGAHLQAMQVLKNIATGKTIGYFSNNPPKWAEVHDIWVRDGREI